MNEHSYHITIGAYGTRLHGGAAPTVERAHNKVGDPFVEADPARLSANREKMTELPCYFTEEQRRFVEKIVPEICFQGRWTYHIAACQPDHIHLLVSAHVDPKEIRRWFKTWLTQRLNKTFGSRTWFARDGSGKWIDGEEYFKAAFEYIRRQRFSEDSGTATAGRSSSEEDHQFTHDELRSHNELRPVVAVASLIPSRPERERIRAVVETLPEDGPLTRARLEESARSIVADEAHLAWTMVLVGNRLWHKRVTEIPFERRILLLPHCMKNAECCTAPYDAEGLHCQYCGACELGRLKVLAESLGYLVMIAEGSPIVMQWILSGKADAILGVGCLRSLERAFEKLQLAGIPAMAVPLHASTCRDSETDLDWVEEMIRTPFKPRKTRRPNKNAEPTWLHLLRAAGHLFDEEPKRTGEPIDQTSELGLDFLRCGGKFYRPFVTLATFDALTGSKCTAPDGDRQVRRLPDWVRQAAGAIEIFHKASLIHDDIEDDDAFRYGRPTLHRSHGLAVAINVGDYLLGRGYRIISDLRRQIPGSKRISPAEIVVEMLALLGKAHEQLSRGQGTELAWKLRSDAVPNPADMIKVYVLKTSPAFEAALGIGVLLAVAEGAVRRRFFDETEEILARFSRHIGVAFQIRNDLDDWRADPGNKQIVGLDVLHGRPTLLRALAALDADPNRSVEETLTLYNQAGVFEKARQLIEKSAAKARQTAEQIEHLPFRRFLLHLVDTITAT